MRRIGKTYSAPKKGTAKADSKDESATEGE